MYGTITAKDGLRLRKGPSAKTVTLDLMPFGDRVEILGNNAKGPVGDGCAWLRVAWLPAKGARLEGWADIQYVRSEETAVPKPRPVPQLIPEPEPASGLGLVFIALGVALAAGLIWAGFR